MTEAEIRILTMAAGKRIDALVAERIYCWTEIPDDYQNEKRFMYGYSPIKPGVLSDVPNYSTDMGEAWKVLEHLRFMFIIGKFRTEYEAVIYGPMTIVAKADTPALAICRAALLTALATSTASPTTSPGRSQEPRE
jgi:hypothetical protein